MTVATVAERGGWRVAIPGDGNKGITDAVNGGVPSILAQLPSGVQDFLLLMIIRSVGSIERSVNGLLDIAGKVGANTANIPQLQATAPVLGLIVEEAVVQDGYMNALTDGYGGVEAA